MLQQPDLADGELIEQTLAGDSAAFGRLVCRYQDRLYNTMVHLTGSAEDAREVVQDAFVQAFVKLDTFHRAAAFYTWLYRIAFNLGVGRLRRKRPQVSLEQSREATGHEVEVEDDPSRRLEAAECAEAVQEALLLLTADFRAVVVLRELEGYRYEEIAQILKLPVGTVRSRLHRARCQLREHLSPVYEEQLE